MKKLASSILDSIKQVAEENPTLVTSLLAAGGTGALGGALLTGESDDPNETSGKRTLRRIKNALIGAGLGAGAAGLLTYGADKLTHALPVEDVDPATKAWNSDLTRLVGATGAAGVTGILHNRGAANKAQDLLSSLVPKSKGAKDPIYALERVLKNKDAVDKLYDIAGHNGDTLSNILRDAGVSTKGLGPAIDKQGLLPGVEWLEKKQLADDAPLVLKKGKDGVTAVGRFLQNAGGRHIARNKYTYLAGLAGLALPEIGSTAVDYIGSLLGGTGTNE